ncbi:unnamed protein product [Angiostrongylus costaricensis]|uniref:T-box domain-containing protein n=1 Tax=Angiostrongylus costaricensis TaxID=334426 RepID=A0A158PJ59_ANGCS|nr:unnamed protein product [Angiostrongylus costaricensis]
MPKDFSIDYLLSDFDNSQKDEGIVKRGSIRFRLEGISLWRRFHALGTEMIVTKSGRRMFPVLSISISGLETDVHYSLLVDMECVDSKRYRYSFHQSKWTATGPGEAELPCRTFVHPDSPARGAHWMKGSVSFDKIKLTNNQLDQNGHIIVNSMHRYLPRIHLPETRSNIERITISFEETTFIAVTAYQNHRITSLKIESNPFAKGFRECELDDPRILPFLLPFYGLAFPFRNS